MHHDLLDWLAIDFVKRSWSIKSIHREIVCSATYRQSSRQRPELESIDATEPSLRAPATLRVEAEIIRDLALQAGGLLSTKLGGPSVFPEQADGRARRPGTSRDLDDEPGRRPVSARNVHVGLAAHAVPDAAPV